MRRPQATTVSAARMNASRWRGRTARAFASASRTTWLAGNSRGRGVSSISAASTWSGTMPIWRSNSSRRGEAEASTRIGMAASAAQVQHANQREQAARRIMVDRHPAGQALGQQFRTLIVQRAPADIDRLDLGQALVADRLVIALADEKIVFDDAAERGERQDDRLVRPVGPQVVQRADLHDQPVFLDREMQMVRAGKARQGREPVILKQVGNRGGTLVLYGAAAPDNGAFVERDLGDPLRCRRGRRVHLRLSRNASDRACASSPSASASRIAAGARASRLAALQPTIVVRFMKSSTPRPEAKRALRAVGNTWFGPAT